MSYCAVKVALTFQVPALAQGKSLRRGYFGQDEWDKAEPSIGLSSTVGRHEKKARRICGAPLPLWLGL
jgi:hypothetical protein